MGADFLRTRLRSALPLLPVPACQKPVHYWGGTLGPLEIGCVPLLLRAGEASTGVKPALGTRGI